MDKVYHLVGFIVCWGVISAIAVIIGSIFITFGLYLIRSLRVYHHPIVGGKVNGKELTFVVLMKYTWESAINSYATTATIGGYLFPLWSKAREHSWYSDNEDEDED